MKPRNIGIRLLILPVLLTGLACGEDTELAAETNDPTANVSIDTPNIDQTASAQTADRCEGFRDCSQGNNSLDRCGIMEGCEARRFGSVVTCVPLSPSLPGCPNGACPCSRYNNSEQTCRTQFGCGFDRGSCSTDNAQLCGNAGGTCERAVDTRGRRHDLCRWTQASSSTSCRNTAGLWTSRTSSFARQWPTAVPAGVSGACITQMENLGGLRADGRICNSSNRSRCSSRGGFCERAFNTRGDRHDLCRWSITSPNACNSFSDGIWTSASSSFSREWPTAVRGSLSGACITQMQNIGGRPR